MMIRSDNEIFKSKSSKDIAEYLRGEKGFNVIPIKPSTKEPDLVSLTEWFDKKCDLPVSDKQGIAILHGKISGTYALDLDHKDILGEIFNNTELVLKSTLVIKTPKQGNHIIYKAKDNDFPPKNIKLFNKEGKKIDIKTQGGYTLLPPSQHNEVNGNYEFVSETIDPFAVKGSTILETLESLGYYEESKLESLSYSEINSSYNNWPIDELETGGYTHGERRRKQNSYYIKLRKDGKSELQTKAEILRVNQTCKPEPLKLIEVNQNIKHAEIFYQRIKNIKVTPVRIIDKEKQKEESELATDYMKEFLSKYNFATLRDTEEILYYQKGVYRQGGEVFIKELCQQKDEECSIHITREIIAKIQRSTYKDRPEFDKDSNILNLKNGLLDIKTGLVTPHNKDQLYRIQLPVEYDKDATCPIFDKCLGQWLPDEKDRVMIIEQAANVLLKKNGLLVVAMYNGFGGNGKSKYLIFLSEFLGKENIAAVSIHDLVENRFAAARLDGKLANIYADIEKTELEKVGKFKLLSAGDNIEVEKKGKDAFIIEPIAKHFFSTNKMPSIDDDTDALYRRFQVTDWVQQFLDSPNEVDLENGILPKDPFILEKLCTKTEFSGFLNLLITTAKKLQEQKCLSYPQSIQQIREIMREKSDSITKFAKDCLVVKTGAIVPRRIVEQIYGIWSNDHQEVVMSDLKFNSKLKQTCKNQIHYEKIRVIGFPNPIAVWVGLELNMPGIKKTCSSVPEIPSVYTSKSLQGFTNNKIVDSIYSGMNITEHMEQPEQRTNVQSNEEGE